VTLIMDLYKTIYIYYQIYMVYFYMVVILNNSTKICNGKKDEWGKERKKERKGGGESKLRME